jgi:hypothetical protein
LQLLELESADASADLEHRAPLDAAFAGEVNDPACVAVDSRAPVTSGVPAGYALREELVAAFCRTARHVPRIVFSGPRQALQRQHTHGC